MDKQFLLTTIDKYHLNGIVEKVKWVVKDKTLHVKFISLNKDMTGEIRVNEFDLEDEDVAIFNTSQLYKLIGITGQYVNLSYQKQHKITTKLLIADNIYSLEYSLSDTMLIPKTPKIEEPEYDYTFLINKELIEKYTKAKKAISETETVSIESVYDPAGAKAVQFTIGEINEHSNKVSFLTPADKMDIPSVSLPFNAIYIKEILDNNRDLTQGIGYVSEQGLMKLVIKSEKTEAIYYLTSKE